MPANNNPPFFTLFFFIPGLLRLGSIYGLEAITGNLASITGLYIFGDSLVDAGNNNYLPISIAKGNYPPNGIDFPNKKPTGRFCNGKNAADAIAEKFGLPLPPPYLSLKGIQKRKERETAAVTGVNFASNGAGIFDSSGIYRGQVIPLPQQLDHWLSIYEEVMSQLGPSKAQIHLSKSLFVVVIGSNDILYCFRSFGFGKMCNPQQYTQSMVDKFKAQLKIIQESGARKFLIFGVPQLGCAPKKRDKNSAKHECNEDANIFASLYNEALVKMLQQLKEELQNSMTYSYFDIFNSTADIISNPVYYGLGEVRWACCGRGKLNADIPCLPFAKICSDRTKYLFWDYFGHPTEAGARLIVDLMFTDDSQYMFPLTISQLVSP